MKQKYKQPWIDALRSGKYKQGQYRLYNEDQDTYCCLGVLCKINNLESYKNESDLETYFRFNIRSSSVGLPVLFSKKINITPMQEAKLTSMNDSYISFEEIANWIEQNL